MPTTTTQIRLPLGRETSPETLRYINEHLATLSPTEILEWAMDTLPNLYQTTAFGLTGLVTLDMIHKISTERQQPHAVPLIFLDTLYHFKETIALAQQCQETYHVPLKIFRPSDYTTAKAFEHDNGPRLWETDEATYDYLVKVEPAHRAYAELNVQSVITGRRRSQKGDRESIPILEIDSTGLIKLNPLAYWDYQQVWTYIRANKVPYNALVDQGYRSIGDWHSTKAPSTEGDNERSGRWSNSQKTECGLHKDYFKMRAAFVAAKNKKKEQEESHRSSIRIAT
ncbi:phosphoadenosine phosphosulfate reductase [Spinellus fusiger]|nr:phosphoadenosine phosphosulfate reductase [Spinellus fusiger]